MKFDIKNISDGIEAKYSSGYKSKLKTRYYYGGGVGVGHISRPKIPKDLSTLTPSQLVFLYLAYFEGRGKIPPTIAQIDWARVDAKQAEEAKEREEIENLQKEQIIFIDKSAQVNEKIPQREATLQNLQAQEAQCQDIIKELEGIKKPSDEQKAQLESQTQHLATLQDKLQTAQTSLQNLQKRKEILAQLYDITTGEGLNPTLLFEIVPSYTNAKKQIWYLSYEIPKRKTELAQIKNTHQNQDDDEKKQELAEQIADLEEIIDTKQTELAECHTERDELEPVLIKNRAEYTKAKEDLDFLESNPAKLLPTPTTP